MPVKKNSETRHKILDKLLRDKYHHYDMKDLNRICNEELLDRGFEKVSLRLTQKDIKYIEGPTYDAPIEYYDVPATNHDTGRAYTKKCLRYEDPSFSIFKEVMTDDERGMMAEALDMFSQFSGLPNEYALNCLRIGMKRQQKDKIVGFSESPMSDTGIFGDLFKAINNRVVIKLHYHTFSAVEEKKSVIVHPYYLREYNRRWYVFCAAEDTGKLLQFALDRIDKVEIAEGYYFKRNKYNIEEILKKVVGVTVYEDRPVQPIIFWVSDNSKEYVETKKIHWSQYQITDDEEEKLRQENTKLQGGRFYQIECKENYELIRELCSFGENLVVVSSETDIQGRIKQRLQKMLELYK